MVTWRREAQLSAWRHVRPMVPPTRAWMSFDSLNPAVLIMVPFTVTSPRRVLGTPELHSNERPTPCRPNTATHVPCSFSFQYSCRHCSINYERQKPIVDLNSRPFMDQRFSLSCSHEVATRLVPHKSNPHFRILFTSHHSYITLPPTLWCQVVSY
jgi:hypothetical protein